MKTIRKLSNKTKKMLNYIIIKKKEKKNMLYIIEIPSGDIYIIKHISL